jgi:hypothetical protein
MSFRPVDPDLISKTVAAAILGVSVRKVEYETIAGRMPAPFQYSARCLLYSRREIEAFAAKRDAEAKAEAERAAAAKAAAMAKRSRAKATA